MTLKILLKKAVRNIPNSITSDRRWSGMLSQQADRIRAARAGTRYHGVMTVDGTDVTIDHEGDRINHGVNDETTATVDGAITRRVKRYFLTGTPSFDDGKYDIRFVIS